MEKFKLEDEFGAGREDKLRLSAKTKIRHWASLSDAEYESILEHWKVTPWRFSEAAKEEEKDLEQPAFVNFVKDQTFRDINTSILSDSDEEGAAKVLPIKFLRYVETCTLP